MTQMITGYWVSQMVYVAPRIGLADRLADGPKSAGELAQETGTHGRTLYRLFRALAGVDVFSEEPDGRFALSDVHVLADIGGENGTNLVGALNRYPAMQGRCRARAWSR
jgi:hypothetical protein